MKIEDCSVQSIVYCSALSIVYFSVYRSVCRIFVRLARLIAVCSDLFVPVAGFV